MDIRTLYENLLEKGFFHIFSANVINKFILFGTSFVLVHTLSKDDYGNWAYAMNNISFFLLFSGLGVNNGVLYYGALTEDKNKRQSFFKFAVNFGIIFNIIIAIILLISTYVLDNPLEGSRVILRYLSLLPLCYIVIEIFQGYLRSDLKNREFSLLTIVNSTLLFVFILFGALFYSLKGIILAHYLAYSLSILFAILLCKKNLNHFENRCILSRNFKWEFIKYSSITSLTNAVSSILYLLDIFLIGIMIKDASILASYKTATIIPFALNFIPLSIMIFIGPYFTKMSKNYDHVKNYYIMLKRSVLALNICISTGLYIFAPHVIQICFGKDYLDSVTVFRILIIGYFIAGTFRIPNGNLLANLGKVKINLIVAIISSTFNIIFDILLISKYGSIGAAITTLSIFIISSLITEIYLMKILHIKIKDYLNSGVSL
jgi:O-antigen/teichoic acid export membrane protein